MRIRLLKHLESQADEREINIKFIKETLLDPEQIATDLKGLKVAQRKYVDDKKNKEYLIRVIFREEKDLRIGITVYKTSKVRKYWRKNENKI